MVRTLSTLSSRRLALVYQNNELGRFMLPIVQALVHKHGAELVATVPAEPDGSNGAAAAQTVAAQRPHAILLLAAGAALMSFMKSLPADARVPVYALSLAGSTALIDQMGPAARGMAFTQVVPQHGPSDLNRLLPPILTRLRPLPSTQCPCQKTVRSPHLQRPV